MRPACVLGIETSCDETAAALWDGNRVLSYRTTTQVLHEQYGGVVPELASRAHEKLLIGAVEGVLEDVGFSIGKVDAVAVTYGPGLAGALLVGVSFAKGIASAASIPLIGVNHLEGHVWSSQIRGVELPIPFLCLLISGGHTYLIGVEEFGRYRLIGGTRDDAAGELFDKVGRMIGFHFPAGQSIDKDALSFKGESIRFPRSRLSGDPCGFSFSGLKTAVLYYLRERFTQGEEGFDLTVDQRQSVSAGLMEAVGDMLVSGLSAALENENYKAIAVAGGVAASQVLRKRFAIVASQRNLPLFIPPLSLCTDNGAMIAYVGFRRLVAGQSSPFNLAVDPRLDLFNSSP